MVRVAAGKTIAVLGANGFIGSHLLRRMAELNMPSRAILRRPIAGLPSTEQRVLEDFSDSGALLSAIGECSHVVHLADEAGRLETVQSKAPIASSLAQALENSDARVLFASSIYARLDEEGRPNEYGKRKRYQEQLLLKREGSIGLRLPPIYGPGCGGSFAMLERAVAQGTPLPLGLATAPRSYLSIHNLCDLLLAILKKPSWRNASPAIYEPEDEVRISTRELSIALGSLHGRRTRLIPIPRGLFSLAAAPFGKEALVSGAFDPLAARDNPILAKHFGWHPVGGLPATLFHPRGASSLALRSFPSAAS